MPSRIQSKIRIGDLGDLGNRSGLWARTLPLLSVVFCLLVYYAAIIFEAMLSLSRGMPIHDYAFLYASLYAWAHHLDPYLVYPLELRWMALNSPTEIALLGSPYFNGTLLIGAPLFYELYQNQENRLVSSETKLPAAGHSELLTEAALEMSCK